MLEFKNVTFEYVPGRGLREASFSMAPGEVIGVVGGNGAGKSTLLGLAAAALVPQYGTVTLANTELSGRTRRWTSEHGIAYRRRVGYLTELAPVYEEMTVARYLRFRAKLRGENFLRIRRRVADALDRCGLADVRKTSIRLLSFGMRRRVALAEALLTLPTVLVLDDPFAGVDAALRLSLGKVIQDVSTHSHVLISGHDPLMLEACCTRFLLLEEGRVVDERLNAQQAMEKLMAMAEPTERKA